MAKADKTLKRPGNTGYLAKSTRTFKDLEASPFFTIF
jgi:hypothetical protein